MSQDFAASHPSEHALLTEMLASEPELRPTCRGILVKEPLCRMESQYFLQTISEAEHYKLAPMGHRRQRSSGSSSFTSVPK